MEKPTTDNQDSKIETLLVDCETLARRYGVSEKFIRKRTQEGFFPCVKLSRRCTRWPVEACDQIVERFRISAISEIG